MRSTTRQCEGWGRAAAACGVLWLAACVGGPLPGAGDDDDRPVLGEPPRAPCGVDESSGLPKESCCDHDEECQDGIYCNGREQCNCWGGCEPAPGPIVCDDGIICTTDFCDEALRACRFMTACADGNACTRDVCNPDGTCSYPPTPLGFPCNDGMFCTMGSTCDGVGFCIGSDRSPCDDSPNCPNVSCDEASETCGCGWTDDIDFATGTGDGLSADPSNPLHPDCALPGNLCLDSSVSTSRHIWVPNSPERTVAKLDVDTGAQMTGFPRTSLGYQPSRTLQDPRDGSVWLGNRAVSYPDNPARSSILHLDADGNVICWTGLPGVVRALAIDRDYNVWAGLWQYQQIVKLDGNAVGPVGTGAPDSGSYPTCPELGRWEAGGRPYGGVGDAAGNVWFVLNANWGNSFDSRVQSLLKVPIANPAGGREWLVPPSGSVGGCFNTYGVAVDGRGRILIGSYNCGTLIRYDPSTNGWTYVSASAHGHPRGVALTADGTIYTALHNTRIARIPDDLSRVDRITLGATATSSGTAVDYAGRIWGVTYGEACRVDVSAWPAYTSTCFDTGGDPYAYTDMTGMQHLLFTRPNGTWTIALDSGYADAIWQTIEWTALESPGVTDVSVRARTAATQAGLAAAAWTSGHTDSPADISTVVVNPNQWIQVEVTLSTTDPSQTPVLYDLDVHWVR
ncbi:MAG: hypothetical protein JXB32_15125 [Deltaproteobacteria bacterium]|nr:hypothetical protein [Deltaproteobacteria bacterium]